MWKVLGAMYPEDRVARCTVERRMAALGLSGVGNSRTTRTTRPAPQGASHPGDKLERNFTASAPNMKWVADITYVPTWSGFVYVAFIMDLFSRAIVGWSVDTTLRADLALNALEHAMWERGRRKHEVRGVIHHSDKGAQGGFNWSSQHPDREGSHGTSSGMVEGPHGKESNDLSRSPVEQAEHRARVLEGNRFWRLVRGRGCGGRRVTSGRDPLVPSRWRHADDHVVPARGPVPVIRRA